MTNIDFSKIPYDGVDVRKEKSALVSKINARNMWDHDDNELLKKLLVKLTITAGRLHHGGHMTGDATIEMQQIAKRAEFSGRDLLNNIHSVIEDKILKT